MKYLLAFVEKYFPGWTHYASREGRDVPEFKEAGENRLEGI